MQDHQNRQLDLGVDFLIAFFGDEAGAFAREQLQTSREAGNPRETNYWDAIATRTEHRLERLGTVEGLSEEKELVKA